MFIIDSEEALVSAFRPRDRRALELPSGVSYPRFQRDSLAWSDPTGAHVHLLFCVPGGVPTGISFRREPASADAGVAHMCDWCHAYGSSSEIGLLSADLNSRKRVGVYLCVDLRCREKLEDAANRCGESVVERAKELLARMGRFAQEALRLDLSGAGRE